MIQTHIDLLRDSCTVNSNRSKRKWVKKIELNSNECFSRLTRNESIQQMQTHRIIATRCNVVIEYMILMVSEYKRTLVECGIAGADIFLVACFVVIPSTIQCLVPQIYG